MVDPWYNSYATISITVETMFGWSKGPIFILGL